MVQYKDKNRTHHTTAQQSPTPNWQFYQSTTSQRRGGRLLKTLAYITFGCLTIAALWFIWMNVQPYILMVKTFSQASNLDFSLVNFVLALPLIGWLLGTIASLTTTIIGFALWAIIQFFELLPSFLTKDLDALKLLIFKLEQMEYLPPSANDHPFVAQLKEQHNNMPVEWIRRATVVSGFVYLVDLLLCLICYPPINGGWTNLELFVAAPSLQDVDWANLLAVVVTLFAVEIIWRAWNWLFNLVSHFQVRPRF